MLFRNGSAADRDGPGAARAAAGRDRIRVALQDADLLDRNIQMLRDELGIGGQMPLPGRLGSIRTVTEPSPSRRTVAFSAEPPEQASI